MNPTLPQLGEAVTGAATEFKSQACDALDQGQAKAKDAYRAALSFAKENPALALGIAVGAGALLAFLCKRK